MRLPSIDLIFTELVAVLRRFPLPMLSALLAFLGGSFLTDGGDHFDPPVRMWAAGSIGLPLLVGLTLLLERRWRNLLSSVAVLGAAVALLVSFFLAWGFWNEPVAWRRTIQFLLAAHAVAVVLPWLGRGSSSGFWQYNRALFQRFLVATIFAAVLFVGLAVALVALDQLFGLDVDGDFYLRLFFGVFYLFHPAYFLGGIAERLEDLEHETSYPRGLKVFAQYILLPIVSVYLVILILYLGKVLWTRSWPSGWIGWLVSSVSVAGVLSLLLLHPAQDRADSRWIRHYRRLFYLTLLPALVMLLVAVGKRIGQYGVTENRYFLAVLAAWMTGIALYFLARRAGRIEVIPATLGAIALITSFGPWGAYTISRQSQVARLESIVQRTGMLDEGRLRRPPTELAFEDRREISALLHYLYQTHGNDPMRGWMGVRWSIVDNVEGDDHRYSRLFAVRKARETMRLLGLDYVDHWQTADSREFNYWSGNPSRAVPLDDFDLAFRVRGVLAPFSVTAGEVRYALQLDRPRFELVLMRDDEQILSLPVTELVDGLRAHIQADTTSSVASGSQFSAPYLYRVISPEMEMLLAVHGISGNLDPKDRTLHNFEADVYLREQRGQQR